MIDVSKSFQSLGEFINTVITLREHSTASLPQFTKPFMIESPVFIQDNIFQETELLNDILSSIYDLYSGYIFLAVKIDSVIDRNGRRLRDKLSTISTNSYINADSVDIGNASYSDISSIIEGFTTYNKKSNLSRKQRRERELSQVVSTEADNSKFIQSDTSRNILSGRLLEVPIIISEDEKGRTNTFTLPIYLKLNPRIFPDALVTNIITANIDQDSRKRWLQYRAGEISFFKDFLLQLDLVQKRNKALKQDKKGVLYDILSQRHKGLIRRLLKLSFVNKNAQNLFNSIFIFNSRQLKRAASEAGLNFKKYSDRQKFFNRNMAMFLVGVDNQYNVVDFFIDSIKEPGRYSFSQIKKASKNNDNFDIVEIIQALQQGQVTSRTF